MRLWQHIRAILLLPVMVAIVIPAMLLGLFGWHTAGLWAIPTAIQPAPSILGAMSALAGLGLVVTTIRQFATVGRGTLAPWNPTEKLVVQGVYRYVRNPMISGVMGILLGEVMISVSVAVLIWFGVFVLANTIYIPLAEEPGLVKRFGGEYEVYRSNVPRWIPRLTPWNKGGVSHRSGQV
ncbi:MAG: isoprenylcysteine carboxylmethyltransferase family protein [Planctomycetaceae bacterium]|nr:isoprenylcysteine carboxylmethyltransferase family protein [Planctomycetaceae bacterium]